MSSFEAIYHRYYRPLFAIANKVIGDKDEIQDILQEVFASYFTNTEIKKQTISQPYSWLVRATLNKCIDQVSRAKKQVTLEVISDMGKPDEKDIDRETRQIILRKAIKKLSKQEMKIVLLYSNSFSYKEIAEVTGINYASVGKKLSRTLQKLKLILKQMDYEMY